MQVISLEDCRRVFIATLKFVYRNDTDTEHTYQLGRNRERLNFPDNSSDIVVVPTKVFEKAVRRVVIQLGLHPEQTNAYINTFGDLAWILRPHDREHHFRTSLSDKRLFHGKSKAVYIIDRIKFDKLCEMNGVVVKGDSNQPLMVTMRNPDGDIVLDKNERVQMTTVTYGLVQDKRYNSVTDFLDEKIKEKDRHA